MQTYADVRDHVPAERRAPIEDVLRSEPPAPGSDRVLCHADLGIEHVLVDADSGAVTGVVDWSDASRTDPAHDLAPVYRDLGPAGLHAVLRAYRLPITDPEGLERRARFLARCRLLEDLAHGLASGEEVYIVNSLRALAWLFPASGQS